MTSEQIDNLNECQKCGAVGGAVLSWSENGVARAAWCCPRCVSRLLDEREALREALTGLENWVTRNVSAEYIVGTPGPRIEALGVARQTLDKVCWP